MKVWDMLPTVGHSTTFMVSVEVNLYQYDVMDDEQCTLPVCKIVPLSTTPKHAADVHAWLTLAFGKDANIVVEGIDYNPKGCFYYLRLSYSTKDEVLEVKC